MDSLWDDSQLLERSPPRQQSSLFLATPVASPSKHAPNASGANNASRASTSNKPSTNPDLADIDALFADIDDLDDDPRPSKETRSASANTKSKSARPSAVVNVLLSDDEDDVPTVGVAGGAAKDDEDDAPKKKKRKLVKLDENRLLGENGLKVLVAQHKDFKPRGKGNEAKDLKRLLQVYQFWSVKLYPRSDFRETVQKVEKLCHSRRMHNALHSWKTDLENAEKGILHTVESGNGDIDLNSDSDDDAPSIPRAPSLPPPPPASTNTGAPKPPVARKPPPVQSAPMDDDWDFDAMLDEEEKEQEMLEHHRTVAPSLDVGDDDATMEEDLQPPADFESPPPSQLPTSSPMVHDDEFAENEEMWDMIAEIEGQ